MHSRSPARIAVLCGPFKVTVVVVLGSHYCASFSSQSLPSRYDCESLTLCRLQIVVTIYSDKSLYIVTCPYM